ncbi:hypothetical protein AGMMS49949_07750 [Alphaproteobacteria bacterium]|nr:hypothetical protein AGMMS49949_07750 [Alphaproteobacteria bacterium]GHS99027.1 hypothetical protein AGMMS50296_6990 [Alphaproteobacteria bacterium]
MNTLLKKIFLVSFLGMACSVSVSASLDIQGSPALTNGAIFSQGSSTITDALFTELHEEQPPFYEQEGVVYIISEDCFYVTSEIVFNLQQERIVAPQIVLPYVQDLELHQDEINVKAVRSQPDKRRTPGAG